MSQNVRILHPAGPDLRALVRYLEDAGWTVRVLDGEDELGAPFEGPAVVHAGALAKRLDLVPAAAGSWCGIGGDVAAARRLEAAGAAAVRLEPYRLSELEDDLRRLEHVRAESVRPQAGPGVNGQASHALVAIPRDEFPAVLKAVGAALAPGISAAEGWLRLLLQDMDVSDPAHRLISHARREIRELERVVRWLRMAAFESPAYLAPVSLNDVIRSALEALGPAPIPITLDLADDLPEVRADARHLRSALDGLLRGVLDPATRPERVEIITSARDASVRLLLREHGHRLDDDHIDGLGIPGAALLHTSFERGMGFSVAKRLLERQDVHVTLAAEPVARLAFRAVFEAVGAHRAASPRVVRGGGR